jgi:hypothetical protein
MTTITGARGERERERETRREVEIAFYKGIPFSVGIGNIRNVGNLGIYFLFRGRAEASERNIFGFKPLPPPASPLSYNHVVLLFV